MLTVKVPRPLASNVMDGDILERAESSDSDAVDEELEHQLYGAIFFSTDSHPSVGTEGGQVFAPSDSGSSRGSAYSSVPRFPQPTEHLVSTQSNFHTSNIPVDGTVNQHEKLHSDVLLDPGKTNEIQESAGPVLVKCFRDQSDSDEDEKIKQNYLELTKSVGLSSTDYSTEESDCESVSSIYIQHSKLSCSTPRNSRTDVCDPKNIVLGVSREGSSIVCNVDDSVVIAQLLESSSTDPSYWRVNHEDRMLSSSKKGRDRYFSDAKNSVCTRCGKKGHLSIECRNSGPTCILCGREGHRREDCDRIYCYACFSPGHSKYDCTLLQCLKDSVCERCGLRGHQAHLCTELWRQYRNTVEPGKPIPIPRRMDIQPGGCCNCGNRGHTVDECRRRPFRSNFLGPPPRRRVLVYDQKDIYKRTKQSVNKKQKLKKKKVEKGSRVDKCTKEQTNADMAVSRSKKLLEKQTKKGKEIIRENVDYENQRPTPSDRNLEELQRTVNEKLFAQITEQMHENSPKSIELSVTSNTDIRTPGATQKVVRPGPKRKPTMDGAAFLPLELDRATPDHRRRSFTPGTTPNWSNHRPHGRSRHNADFSPFSWVNERTAENRLNEERIPVRDTKPEFSRPVDPLFSHARPNKSTKKNKRSISEEVRQRILPKKPWGSSEWIESRSALHPRSNAKPHIMEKKLKRKSKPHTKQPSTTVGCPSGSAKRARLGLQSLLIDSDQPSTSAPVDTTCSGFGEARKKKGKRKQKPTSAESVTDEVSFRSSGSYRPKHPDGLDWKHFLRESSRTESWEHVNGEQAWSSQKKRPRADVCDGERVKRKKNEKKRTNESLDTSITKRGKKGKKLRKHLSLGATKEPE